MFGRWRTVPVANRSGLDDLNVGMLKIRQPRCIASLDWPPSYGARFAEWLVRYRISVASSSALSSIVAVPLQMFDSASSYVS